MKFNIILISMAIGLLSHSVISAPVDNSNDVADGDNVDVKPYHIDVPGADIDIDDNGVQVEKKPEEEGDANSDNEDTATDANSAAAATEDEGSNTEDNEDATASDPSALDKRSPLLGNVGSLGVGSDGIRYAATGNNDNDLADEDLMQDDDMRLGKRRLGGGLAATRDGVDVAPLGMHLGRDSDDPNMATASDAAQLKDVTDLLTKRDGSNDDDGDDVKKHATNDEDLMTKREEPPSNLSPEELDDFNTRKRDRLAHSAHHQAATYDGTPVGYPNQYMSEDTADALT